MLAHKVQKDFTKRIAKLAKLAYKVGNIYDKETIHSFRTGTKKLRALLRLTNIIKGVHKLQLPADYKELYDIAGKMRDPELIKEYLKEHQLPVFFAHLDKHQEKAKKKWVKKYSPVILQGFYNQLSEHFYHLPLSAIEDFLQHNYAFLQTALNEHPDDEDFHDCRKKVKDMLYVIKWADKKWEEAKLVTSGYNIDLLNTLSDVLGNYNDLRNVHDILCSYEHKDMQETERNEIAKICGEIAVQKEEQKQQALTMLHKYVRSV